MRRLASAAAICAIMIGSVGCYETVVRTPGARATGPTHQDRQWFTLGGLVRLSPPTGEQCDVRGIAHATSSLGVMDFFIDAGLALLGGAVGASACAGQDEETFAACVSGASAVAPFLLSARTVRYQCMSSAPRLVPGRRPLRSHADTPGGAPALELTPARAPAGSGGGE